MIFEVFSNLDDSLCDCVILNNYLIWIVMKNNLVVTPVKQEVHGIADTFVWKQSTFPAWFFHVVFLVVSAVEYSPWEIIP